MGAPYGGFLTSCLGDVPCAKDMRQTVLAGKPDLLAPCLWYFDWLAGADVPSVKYQPIACPERAHRPQRSQRPLDGLTPVAHSSSVRFGSAAWVALGCAVACSGEGPQSSFSGTAGRAALPSACSPGVATYTDDDGDGFYGKYGPTLCPGDQVPEGYILASETPERDCDDSDPTETSGLMYFLDSDGDGYGNPGLAGTWACPDNPPFGRVSNQIDCDDTDPSGVTSESDDDGDGYHPFCETHQARNPALAQLDCDDHDSTRNPRAGELASDGIDSNCDGYDFPFIHDCSALPELAPSALRPRSECTDQSDLALLAVSDCWSCQDHYLDVIVANRGSTPAYAVLSLGDDPSFDVLVGELPPLSISAPTRIQTTPYPPPYTLRVHERGDPPRCAATDDSVVLVDKLFCDP